MSIKINLLDGGKIPEYKSKMASGLDCYAAQSVILPPGSVTKVRLGFRMELPCGFEGQIRPRSGMCSEGIIGLLGTIDCDYRGEVSVMLHNATADWRSIFTGQRIAQLVVAPVARVETELADELSATARGAGGFGSTGSA